MIWSKRLTPEEWIVATEALRTVATGGFLKGEESTVTGFSAEELLTIYLRRESIDDEDEEGIQAIGQCLNNLVSYPHKRVEEVEDWLCCTAEELHALTRKWFGPKKTYFDRLE